MTDSQDDFLELSRALLEEFAALGHRMSPHMRYAARGERGVMRVLECTDEPLTPTELARCTHLTNARIANVLRALEDKGFIIREHSATDRRRVTVHLTDAGRAEIQREKREFETQACAFLKQLGYEDTADALRLLKKTNSIIDANRAAGTAVIPSEDRKELHA